MFEQQEQEQEQENNKKRHFKTDLFLVENKWKI